MLTRRACAMLGAALVPVQFGRSLAATPFRIGVLNDQSGVFSSSTGPGASISARMAVQDFGGQVNGRPIEVLAADHQNKPDVGASIARRWFDVDNVEAIVDIGNSAIALAAAALAREKNKVVLISAAGATALTGSSCSPNTVQWTYDTWSTASALTQALADEGRKTWFCITADYAFGHSLQAVVTDTAAESGGRVIGSARHPIDTTDFSALLLRARQSGADVIGLANGGDDTTRAIKQAREFGITPKQTVVGLAAMISDVDAIGPEQAQGLLLSESFYWNLNERTRAYAQRWSQQNRQRMPTMMQAGVYSAVLHYLKALADVPDAGDGAAVVRRMKAIPIDDPLFGRGRILPNGRAALDMHVLRAKAPAQVKEAWDYLEVVKTIPGERSMRPSSRDACPLLASAPAAMGVTPR
ncbi:ABC transporter substrate-binding protein (plasmid) [Roseomonas sp. OT10]|uniref:ABC transporter substrate-binding protein n=1 Tax=Roseomonas cutis TaxID=2897332 RepID=UPI001E45A012|nr:ABC transporter substrate-binding protein [Roseomonas sp. OT10]UFN51544.1 ABC transporter substrate-binding protein [Roseomonas sp. OT10]